MPYPRPVHRRALVPRFLLEQHPTNTGLRGDSSILEETMSRVKLLREQRAGMDALRLQLVAGGGGHQKRNRV